MPLTGFSFTRRAKTPGDLYGAGRASVPAALATAPMGVIRCGIALVAVSLAACRAHPSRPIA